MLLTILFGAHLEFLFSIQLCVDAVRLGISSTGFLKPVDREKAKGGSECVVNGMGELALSSRVSSIMAA